jgi:hypothetical protein
MATRAIALLCLLVSACASHERACNPEEARTLAASFLRQVILSDNCSKGLKDVEADAFWGEECKRRESPGKSMELEFSRRTTGDVDEIRSKDGRTYAILRFVGPDQFAFQLALGREGFCADTQDTELLGLVARVPLPGRTGCGERFWADIPVKEYLGALALNCRNGRWTIGKLQGSSK